MFTGIIQSIGTLANIEKISNEGADCRLRIDVGQGMDLSTTVLGDSIAVSGVCLTVTAIDAQVFQLDVSNETLKCTTLGDLRVGDRVNLEPALRAGDRLGGHLVSGHVDCRGRVVDIHSDDSSSRMTFSLPDALAALVAAKGSITIEGVSLTVNSVARVNGIETFAVNLIPHTLARTTLNNLQTGDRVNLEIDMLARYMARLLEKQQEE